MFKKLNYDIDLVAEAFHNLRYRDRTVLILCRDRSGKYILGTKKGVYPKGICRMIGGGLDKNEKVIEGAIREINEELGLFVNPEELIELIKIKVTGIYNNKTYKTEVFVYFLNSEKDDYLAGDDVSEIIRLSEKEYKNLVKRFYDLKSDDFFNQKGDEFSWGDYGKVYGFIHQETLNTLLKNKFLKYTSCNY